MSMGCSTTVRSWCLSNCQVQGKVGICMYVCICLVGEREWLHYQIILQVVGSETSRSCVRPVISVYSEACDKYMQKFNCAKSLVRCMNILPYKFWYLIVVSDTISVKLAQLLTQLSAHTIYVA